MFDWFKLHSFCFKNVCQIIKRALGISPKNGITGQMNLFLTTVTFDPKSRDGEGFNLNVKLIVSLGIKGKLYIDFVL